MSTVNGMKGLKLNGNTNNGIITCESAVIIQNANVKPLINVDIITIYIYICYHIHHFMHIT